MRRFLVSSFLAEVTQQIHSFRASGVIAAQRPFAAASDSMALRKSAGSLWSVPLVIALEVMCQLRSVSCRPTPALTGAERSEGRPSPQGEARRVERVVGPQSHRRTRDE